MSNIKTKETAKLTVHNHDTDESALIDVIYNFYKIPNSHDEFLSNDIEIIEVKNAPEWATDDLIMAHIEMYEADIELNNYDVGFYDDYDEYNNEW